MSRHSAQSGLQSNPDISCHSHWAPDHVRGDGVFPRSLECHLRIVDFRLIQAVFDGGTVYHL